MPETSSGWWKPIIYSVVHDKRIPCGGRTLLCFGVCQIQVRRNTPFLGSSLQEVLFCLGEIRTIDTILFAKRTCLFTKTGYKELAKTHFNGAVSSFLLFSPLLSHSPWEVPPLHVWLLRAWWDPGCYSECLKECYSEAWKKYSSLPRFDSESLNTTGSIQGVMKCLTEAAICSQLANRDLFGQWARPIHSANTSFPTGSEKKEGDVLGPFFRLQLQFGTIFLNKTPLFPKSQFSGSQLLS